QAEARLQPAGGSIAGRFCALSPRQSEAATARTAPALAPESPDVPPPADATLVHQRHRKERVVQQAVHLALLVLRSQAGYALGIPAVDALVPRAGEEEAAAGGEDDVIG